MHCCRVLTKSLMWQCKFRKCVLNMNKKWKSEYLLFFCIFKSPWNGRVSPSYSCIYWIILILYLFGSLGDTAEAWVISLQIFLLCHEMALILTYWINLPFSFLLLLHSLEIVINSIRFLSDFSSTAVSERFFWLPRVVHTIKYFLF